MLDIMTTATSRIETLREDTRREVVIVIPYITKERIVRVTGVLQRRTEAEGLLLLVEDDKRLGFIATANLAYAKTRSDYFCYLAEDVFPGYYWLEYALDAMRKTGAGLLAFNDGRFFGKLAAFGLVRRMWAKTLYGGNTVFYPGYTSHFADTELSVIAAQTRNMVHNPNALMMEVDYEKHLHPNNADDGKLYAWRAQTGFDGLIAPFLPESPASRGV